MAYDRCKSHKSAHARYWSTRRKPRNGAHKRGLNTKLHLAVDALGMPVRAFITAGPVADCTQAGILIEGLSADFLLADRGYVSNEIRAQAAEQGMVSVIPSKQNRITQIPYDKYIYKLRHLVENAFLKLKRWRGIATRYAKNALSFVSAIHLACLFMWLKIS